ncbi:MAG: hypothetical protein ABR606_12145, partial [Vicinamibacterales bacterium]
MPIRPFIPPSAQLVVAALIVASVPAMAGPPIDYATARLDRKLPAVRVTGPIALDGRLDEATWATAPLAKDFIQNDPREGTPATF